MAVTLGALLLLTTSTVMGDRSYTVRDGDTLASIARRHRVSVRALQVSNRLRNSRIRPGQHLEVPSRGVIFVGRGDTLSSLARRHGVSVADLRRANRLRRNQALQIDQRLRLPGAADEQAESRWGTPRRPGFIDVTRVQTGRRVRMTAVDRRGRVRAAALRRLGQLMQSHRGRGTGLRRPNRRLVALLARISDHFGGRPITLVSGFRSAGGYTRGTSKHTRGRAIDFRIRGVPNTALRDYCKRLPRVGVGYYPRSTFVHLDVRDRSAYWVDWSRPGQAPQYQRRGEPPPAENEPPPSPSSATDAEPAAPSPEPVDPTPTRDSEGAGEQ